MKTRKEKDAKETVCTSERETHIINVDVPNAENTDLKLKLGTPSITSTAKKIL